MTIAIVNALATEAAKELARRGVRLWVLASPYFEGTDEDVLALRRAAEQHWRECVEQNKQRYREMF